MIAAKPVHVSFILWNNTISLEGFFFRTIACTEPSGLTEIKGTTRFGIALRGKSNTFGGALLRRKEQGNSLGSVQCFLLGLDGKINEAFSNTLPPTDMAPVGRYPADAFPLKRAVCQVPCGGWSI